MQKNWLWMILLFLRQGAQVCADAEVCAGEVQVNESLLTGESDEITKKKGIEADVRELYCFRTVPRET